MDFPKNHKRIVEQLMAGRFLISRDALFDELKENESFYSRFFVKSFDYELVLSADHAYLSSKDTNEILSRDVSIFFAILCYELDKEGKNFINEIEYSEFTYDEIDRLFENTSYVDLIQQHNQLKDSERRRSLLNTMSRRNIIEKTGDERFIFTQAYKVFTDFAQELGKQHSDDSNQNDEIKSSQVEI
jgi:hypothetical protein